MKIRNMSLPIILVLCTAFIAGLSPMHNDKPGQQKKDNPTYLVIRLDDIGMSHSVNMALKEILTTGMPVSTSIMFPCPWYKEAVEILKQHPNVAVGIHLTLNSEWKNYRWGPVAGRSAVPSIVDSNGYFFHSAGALYSNHPKMSEIETELRAQIERALHSGLKIDYVDYHMDTAIENPQVRAIVEKLAKEYHLGMTQYFGEQYHATQYRASVDHKTDSLVTTIMQMQPGYNVIVAHIGLDNPELHALIDMNSEGGLSNMAENRQAVLNALMSYRFKDAIKEKDVKLITYRELIQKVGMDNQHAPANF